MSDFLVAYFHTQLEAINSAKKLQAFGLQRDRISIHAPGKQVGAIVRGKSNQPSQDVRAQQDIAEPSYELRSEDPSQAPSLSDSTTLTVSINEPASINEVCSTLKDAGAYLIDVTEKNVTQEYPDM